MEQTPTANITHSFAFRRPAELVVDLSATRAYPPAGQPVSQPFGVRSDFDNEEFIVVRHFLPERFRLLNGTRIAVEDEPFVAVIVLDALGDDAVHDGVAEGFDRVHPGFGLG